MSVVGIVAYRGPYFGIFDTLKEKNPFKKEKGIVGLASKFCIAQFTAIVAGFISYPFDTVRRRLQMQAEKPPDQWLYNGTLDCAVKIVRDEGMGAMFKVRRRHVSLPSPSPPPPHPDGAPLLSPRATAHRPFITRSRPSSPPLAPSCLPDLPPLPLPPSHPSSHRRFLGCTPAPCTLPRAILFPPRFPLPSPLLFSSMPIAHTRAHTPRMVRPALDPRSTCPFGRDSPPTFSAPWAAPSSSLATTRSSVSLAKGVCPRRTGVVLSRAQGCARSRTVLVRTSNRRRDKL